MQRISFSREKLNKTWTFNGKKTGYYTHDIHRYPAKFIPQLSRRLIELLSAPGDNVIDPFCGSGTALLEAKLCKRNSTGVDINPVAVLISKVKTEPINPEILHKRTIKLLIKAQNENTKAFLPKNKNLLDFWYFKKDIYDLGKLFSHIKRIKNKQLRNFFLVAFSDIQKNTSKWLMSSTKPCRDLEKKTPPIFDIFVKKIRDMTAKNEKLWNRLENTKNTVNILRGDTRRLSDFIEEKFELALFSPPYVTSYEYVDLHKLSIMWLENIPDLNHMKKNFIGSVKDIKNDIEIKSPTGLKTIEKLEKKNNGITKKVKTYFQDMQASLSQIDKILLNGGHIAIVIGNTRLRGVDIKNAEFIAETLKSINYVFKKVIKRQIPNKLLPSSRDPETGKFTSIKNKNTKIYSHEYVLLFKKKL